MMFLQYMALPVWFVPLLPYVRTLSGGEAWTLWYGLVMGFGTMASPFVGMFADRFLNAERVLGICNFAGAGLLGAAFFVRSPAMLFVLVLLALCLYMPSWSLTATIGMAHLSRTDFSRVRAFGTAGWVASGAFSFAGTAFGIASFDTTPWIFAVGASVSLCAGVLAFGFLPSTAPSVRGQPLSVADALGLRALVLFRQRSFRRFAILLFLAMIPFQWYNVYCAVYLQETGFRYLTMTINLGQAGEIGFILLVPWILGRFGFRKAMVVGLSALAFRNVCFLLSASCGWSALDFGGILIHGLIFGIFVVGSQMYIAEESPPELRGQAQGLVNLLTAGVGFFSSTAIFGWMLGLGEAGRHNWTATYAGALVLTVVAMGVALFGRGGPRFSGECAK